LRPGGFPQVALSPETAWAGFPGAVFGYPGAKPFAGPHGGALGAFPASLPTVLTTPSWARGAGDLDHDAVRGGKAHSEQRPGRSGEGLAGVADEQDAVAVDVEAVAVGFGDDDDVGAGRRLVTGACTQAGDLPTGPHQKSVHTEGQWQTQADGHPDAACIMHLVQFGLGDRMAMREELATQSRSLRSVASVIVMTYGRPGFLFCAVMRPPLIQ
jgi:hypothetical protein